MSRAKHLSDIHYGIVRQRLSEVGLNDDDLTAVVKCEDWSNWNFFNIVIFNMFLIENVNWDVKRARSLFKEKPVTSSPLFETQLKNFVYLARMKFS